MAPTGIRDRERTKRSLLDAATMLLGERGLAVSLETIAAEAGVTRAGLLHHFPSREALIRAVAEDATWQFHEEVLAHLDPSDSRPGRLLRAYVRALFAGSAATPEADYPGLWHTLAAVPGAAEFLIADTQRWREEFKTDGTHEDRVFVVINAAEGFIAAAQWDPGITESMVARTEQALLALTEGSGPLAEDTV